MCIGDPQINTFTMKRDRKIDAVVLLVSIAANPLLDDNDNNNENIAGKESDAND